jgi:hypothetical protein
MGKFESRDLGEAKWHLGKTVTHDKQRGTLSLSHGQMIINMLQKYGLEESKPSPIPMNANQIAGPDTHTKSCDTIQTQSSQLDPDSSER